ncbi:MAG: hypothetical protein ABSG15_13565 [FCB group bacterium]
MCKFEKTFFHLVPKLDSTELAEVMIWNVKVTKQELSNKISKGVHHA